MKALELARQLENDMESHDGSSLSAFCQGIADDAAAELRRLAEVNAELVREMERYLPVIAKAEDSAVWSELTSGTGIATANGYRAAIAKAKEQQ